MDNKNEELVNCVLYKKINRVESAEISISKTMIKSAQQDNDGN